MKKNRITVTVTRKMKGIIRTLEIRNFNKKDFFYKSYIKIMKLLGNGVDVIE